MHSVKYTPTQVHHSIKCAFYFIKVKIPINKITLFHDEITLNQIETMFQTFKKQQKEFLEKNKVKRICYVMVGGVCW